MFIGIKLVRDKDMARKQFEKMIKEWKECGPKYVTDLGKLIVFPIPSALGAFTGYKLSLIIQSILN